MLAGTLTSEFDGLSDSQSWGCLGRGANAVPTWAGCSEQVRVLRPPDARNPSTLNIYHQEYPIMLTHAQHGSSYVDLEEGPGKHCLAARCSCLW